MIHLEDETECVWILTFNQRDCEVDEVNTQRVYSFRLNVMNTTIWLIHPQLELKRKHFFVFTDAA